MGNKVHPNHKGSFNPFFAHCALLYSIFCVIDEMHSQLHEQAIKLRKVDVIMEMSRAIENQTKQINEFQHQIMSKNLQIS